MVFETKDNPMFRECSSCGTQWKTREAFLSDAGVELIGYQIAPSDIAAGLFLFNHTCGTTLSILVSEMIDLYEGDMYPESLQGTPECRGYCLNEPSLEPCTAQCSAAFARDIMQTLRRWPKSA